MTGLSIPLVASARSTFPRQSRTIFFFQLLVWWGANNLYAIDAHKLLRKFDSKLLFIELTVIQVLIGMLMAILLSIFSPAKRSSPKSNQVFSSFFRKHSSLQLLIGVFHLLGTILTNASYLLIGSTSTLVWKLTEPLAALLLKYIVLKESSAWLSIFGTCTIVSGVLIFSMNSMPVFSLSPIIIANLAFPLRNVLVKKDQVSGENELTTHQRYFSLLSSTLPICLAGLLYKMMNGGLTLEAYPFLIRNAILFNSYQFASVAILEKMEAVTHSLANTIKRFTGIILSFVLLGEVLEVKHITGLFLTIVGFPLYIAGKSKNKTLEPSRAKLHWLSLFFTGVFSFIFGAFFTASMVDSSVCTIASRPSQIVRTFTRTNSSMEKVGGTFLEDVKKLGFKSAQRDLPVYELGGYKPRYNVTYHSYKEALAAKPGNLGDMVWQYSSFIRLSNMSEKEVCPTFQDCEKNRRPGRERIMLYQPSANLFNPKPNMTFQFLYNLMTRNEDNIFIVGIGIQAQFTRADLVDMDRGQEITEKPEDYPLTPGSARLLTTLQKHKYPMLVRGDYTLRVTQLAGYQYGIATGCPSLMLNKDIHLGQTMEPKYKAIMKRVGDKSLKVAINLSGKPRVRRYLIDIFNNYPNSYFYAQGLDDTILLYKYEIPFERIRMFTNVEDWMENLKTMDVAIGGRIHGNMIALGASIPIFVIPPDWRLLELVQKMDIPHAHILDKRWDMEDWDVAKMLSMYPFDGRRFDENRCNIAKVYKYVFDTQGLKVSDHVDKISQIC